MANRPEAEIDITHDLVQALLNDQFPELAGLALRELSRGWDNTNHRLGDIATVRVPHRQVAARLIENEQAWLPLLATQIDLPISAPTHAGTPTDFFPWPWSVHPVLPRHRGGNCTAGRHRPHGRHTRQLLPPGPHSGTVRCADERIPGLPIGSSGSVVRYQPEPTRHKLGPPTNSGHLQRSM